MPKYANPSASRSLLTLLLCIGSPLHSPGTHASPLPAFPDAARTMTGLPKPQDRTGQPAPGARGKLSPPGKQDGTATRKAIQIALAQVADGGSYRWRHKWAKLHGTVQPTLTYRNAAGQVCRHISYSVSARGYQKDSQALACRNSAGNWTIKGS